MADAVERATSGTVRDLLASCVSDHPDDRPKTAGALLGRLRVLHGEVAVSSRTATTHYLTLTKSGRQDVLSALALTEELQVTPAIEEDLAGGCASPRTSQNGKQQEGKFEIFGAELRLVAVVEKPPVTDSGSSRPCPASVRCSRSSANEHTARPMSFKVGDPPNRVEAQNAWWISRSP